MKKIINTILACAALILAAVTVDAQVSQTSPSIPLYYISQPSPLAGTQNNQWTNLVGSGTQLSTNILNGWSATTTVTNTTLLWNPTSNAFVSTTNITTNTSTQFIQFPAKGQQFVPLEWDYSEGFTSNAWITVARSVSGTYWANDTNLLSLTNTASIAGTNTALFNIPMQGYNYARVTAFGVVDGTLNHVFTNLLFATSSKLN